jgi:hypothetical protein
MSVGDFSVEKYSSDINKQLQKLLNEQKMRHLKDIQRLLEREEAAARDERQRQEMDARLNQLTVRAKLQRRLDLEKKQAHSAAVEQRRLKILASKEQSEKQRFQSESEKLAIAEDRRKRGEAEQREAELKRLQQEKKREKARNEALARAREQEEEYRQLQEQKMQERERRLKTKELQAEKLKQRQKQELQYRLEYAHWRAQNYESQEEEKRRELERKLEEKNKRLQAIEAEKKAMLRNLAVARQHADAQLSSVRKAINQLATGAKVKLTPELANLLSQAASLPPTATANKTGRNDNGHHHKSNKCTYKSNKPAANGDDNDMRGNADKSPRIQAVYQDYEEEGDEYAEHDIINDADGVEREGGGYTGEMDYYIEKEMEREREREAALARAPPHKAAVLMKRFTEEREEVRANLQRWLLQNGIDDEQGWVGKYEV